MLPALGALGMLLSALVGCTRVRTVQQTVVAKDVLDATLPQLLARLDQQDKAIQTINAAVDITATTGGQHEGKVTDTPTFAGYIYLRRPADLRMLMLAPILRSRAVDMVSDGKTFKLLISVPGHRQAITGKDEYTTGHKNGLENLRPYIIRDALLIPAATPDQWVGLVKGSRLLPAPDRKATVVEEPDYDVIINRVLAGNTFGRIRVIHFGRLTLRPYQQEIYDGDGNVVTTVNYSGYQKYGDVEYPTHITISRPLEEYSIRLDFTKLIFNGKLEDLQFDLQLPENLKVQTM